MAERRYHRMIAMTLVVLFVLAVGLGFWLHRQKAGRPVTLVSGIPSRVVLEVYRVARNSPTFRTTLGPKEARLLQRDLDALRSYPVSRHAVTACPAGIGNLQGVVLRFHYRNGDRWSVYVALDGCDWVWTDGKGRGWSTPIAPLGGVIPASDRLLTHLAHYSHVSLGTP